MTYRILKLLIVHIYGGFCLPTRVSVLFIMRRKGSILKGIVSPWDFFSIFYKGRPSDTLNQSENSEKLFHPKKFDSREISCTENEIFGLKKSEF